MRQNNIFCDRCGNEVGMQIMKAFVTMRLMGILLGRPLEAAGEGKIDLCADCYVDFKDWLKCT